jgi:hypothetical protein
MTEDERNATFDDCFEHNDHLRANGHLVAEVPLQPPETALTLYWKTAKMCAPLCCARISTPPREARVGDPGPAAQGIIFLSPLYGTTSQALLSRFAGSLRPKRSSRALTLVSKVDAKILIHTGATATGLAPFCACRRTGLKLRPFPLRKLGSGFLML